VLALTLTTKYWMFIANFTVLNWVFIVTPVELWGWVYFYVNCSTEGF